MKATGKKSGALKLLFEAMMVFISIISIFPFLYSFISSFKMKNEIDDPLKFPSTLYLQNYIDSIKDGMFFQLFKNSLLVSLLTMLVLVILGSIASYPLSRRKERVFSFIYYYVLSGIMIPFQAGIVPLFKLVKLIGWTNNIMTLVLISVGSCIPITILVYTGFIRTVPKELDESATIDGCGYIRTFYNIIFPLLKPATATVVILNITSVWNDFMSPLTFITKNAARTLPVGIYMFMGDRAVDYGPIFAFVILSIILPVIAFVAFQGQFYKGIVAGAVKG